MKLCLVVMQGGKEGKEIPVRLPQFLIGRDPQCHLRPASTLISKRHCALLTREDQAFLRDFESTNGTILNKQPLKGEAALKNGDEFQLGPLTFRVKLQAGPAVDTPTPMPHASDSTVPAVKPIAAKSEGPVRKNLADTDEDAFADMLMNIPDDSNASATTLNGEDPISAESTVFQVPGPVEETKKDGEDDPTPAASDSPENEKPKEEEPKKKPAIAPQATSDAAKAILDKYMKRPRPAAR